MPHQDAGPGRSLERIRESKASSATQVAPDSRRSDLFRIGGIYDALDHGGAGTLILERSLRMLGRATPGILALATLSLLW